MNRSAFDAKVRAILTCDEDRKQEFCIQAWTSGVVLTGYGGEAAYRIVIRKVNREMVRGLIDLRQYERDHDKAASTRELYPDKQGKASTDFIYWRVLGFIKRDGTDRKGKPRYRLTKRGNLFLSQRLPIPREFMYLRYNKTKHLLAVSKDKMDMQSAEGITMGVRTFKASRDRKHFEIT